VKKKMYPEVHFPVEANIRCIGVEAQCSPSFQSRSRSPLSFSSNRCKNHGGGGVETKKAQEVNNGEENELENLSNRCRLLEKNPFK
jgi:predicted outer membrane repeat protein